MAHEDTFFTPEFVQSLPEFFRKQEEERRQARDEEERSAYNGGTELQCMATVENQWGRYDPRCSRSAGSIVAGRALCWQHARRERQNTAYWEMEERTMAQMDALAPDFRDTSARTRLFGRLGVFQNSDLGYKNTCSYCNRKARTSRLVVSPMNLRRVRWPLCGRSKCESKLRAWENTARTRRARAEWDMEQELVFMPEPAGLREGIRMQYPSVSRATLRAFLESDMQSATVENASDLSVTALNGSIKVLGFEDTVYAEIRDGVATLRRIPQRATKTERGRH